METTCIVPWISGRLGGHQADPRHFLSSLLGGRCVRGFRLGLFFRLERNFKYVPVNEEPTTVTLAWAAKGHHCQGTVLQLAPAELKVQLAHNCFPISCFEE